MSTLIKKPDYFNLKDIANSGQCFRFLKVEESDSGLYRTIYKDHYLELEEKDDKLCISCDKDTWDKVWINYFDLDSNYDGYARKIRELDDGYEYIKKAFEFSKGIRILRQDSFEMLISYIISQRNRIQKISMAVENLSEAFGKKLRDQFTGKEFYSFPDEKELSTSVSDYKELKLGYRDKYVAEAVNEVRKYGIDYFNTFDRVKKIYGVGDKVANCYLLFGRHDISRFPVDVWIERILNNEFGGVLDLRPFTEFAGIVQQYMFYYERYK